MRGRQWIAVAALVAALAPISGLAETAATTAKKVDKGTTPTASQKAKATKDNSETYTVHKSGDGGNGCPTYSTGGSNPNPGTSTKTKKDDSKKKG